MRQMPFVYFAHQAPVLPIARRWPQRVDGLTLLVGTMSPDFAYALTGTPLQIGAHRLPWLIVFCVPATLVVSWLIARVLARVVAAHVPDLGGFHLHDYRGLAAHRFLPLRSTLCAFLGAWTHSALDHLGHAWGWPAQHWDAYRAVVFEGNFLGRPWNFYRVVQYAGHLVLTPLAIWMLFRYGKRRWFGAAAVLVPEFRTSARSHVVLWGATVIGIALAALCTEVGGRDSSTALMRVSAGVFAGLVFGAFLAERLERAS